LHTAASSHKNSSNPAAGNLLMWTRKTQCLNLLPPYLKNR
jgi:hypothetical protein